MNPKRKKLKKQRRRERKKLYLDNEIYYGPTSFGFRTISDNVIEITRNEKVKRLQLKIVHDSVQKTELRQYDLMLNWEIDNDA